MTADPIDPARVREAVERSQEAIHVKKNRYELRFDDVEQLITAALDSLTQRDLVRELSEAMAGLSEELKLRDRLLEQSRERRISLERDLESVNYTNELLIGEKHQLRSELEAAQRLAETRERMATAAVQLGEKVGELQRELEAARAEIASKAQYEVTLIGQVEDAENKHKRCIDQVEQLRTQLSTAQADAQRLREALQWLEQQSGAALVSDDAGKWAVSVSGFAPLPTESNWPLELWEGTSYVERDEWRDSVVDAIDAARAAQKGAGR